MHSLTNRPDDAAYFKQREIQELAASEKATDPTIKRLHWEMAQRYAYLAQEASESSLQSLS